MKPLKTWLMPPVRFSLLELFVVVTAACIIAWLIPLVIWDVKVLLNTYTAQEYEEQHR